MSARAPLDHVRSYYAALDTGDAAAVAAHGNRRNPGGDLLGFDHAGRGHTML